MPLKEEYERSIMQLSGCLDHMDKYCKLLISQIKAQKDHIRRLEKPNAKYVICSPDCLSPEGCNHYKPHMVTAECNKGCGLCVPLSEQERINHDNQEHRSEG